MVQHNPDIVPGKPWFSTVTGKYWESREAADHYEREEQMRRTMPADSAFDEFTVPELRTLTEGRMASQAFNEAKQASKAALNAFVKLNPWYVDGNENSAVMFDEIKAQMNARKLIPPIEYDDVVRIRLELKDRKRLRINQPAIEAEEQAKLEQEIANRKKYTEAELDHMPLDNLKRLASGSPVEG